MKKKLLKIFGMLITLCLASFIIVSCTHSKYSYEETNLLKIESGNYKTGAKTLETINLPSTVKIKIYNENYAYKELQDTFDDSITPKDYLKKVFVDQKYKIEEVDNSETDFRVLLISGLIIQIKDNKIVCNNYFYKNEELIPYLVTDYMKVTTTMDDTFKIEYNSVDGDDIIEYYKKCALKSSLDQTIGSNGLPIYLLTFNKEIIMMNMYYDSVSKFFCVEYTDYKK